MTRFGSVFSPDALALFPYLTAGYPDQQASGELIRAIIESGADGLEIGIPFSDPMADGLTMQRTNEQALKHGATTMTALHLASWARQASDRVAISLMSYYNPILAFGEDAFCRAAAEAGVDGVIVPDLPPEESTPLRTACQSAGIDYIYMLSPTSTPDRVDLVGSLARGFIYCVALVGVTGARTALATDLDDFLGRARAATNVPLVVGFGISQPEHIRALLHSADGVIVSSALADLIEKTPASQRQAALRQRVEELKQATIRLASS